MVQRRQFLSLVAAGVAAGCAPPGRSQATATAGLGRGPVRVIAFDAFPIFDPRPVSALAERLFPGHGATLTEVWRTRLFEYQWLRALCGRYADFRATAEDALGFALAKTKLTVTAEDRERLLRAHLELGVWPDVREGLAALSAMGLALVFLSNMTRSMLSSNLARAGLDGAFDHLFSTDAIRTYKPDPAAYGMAVRQLGVAKEKILFVPFAGWDAAGAKWFGFETFWVNRLGAPAEELDVVPDGSGPGLSDLVSYVTTRQ